MLSGLSLTNSSPLYVVFGLLIGFMNYRNTERYRRFTGRSPWGIHPVIWGVTSVFLSLVVTVLALIAMSTGRSRQLRQGGGRPVPGPGPFGRAPFPRPGAPGSGPYDTGQPGAAPEGGPGRDADPLRPAGHPASSGAGELTAVSSPPSWQPDPSGRFDFRYWDGDEWTEFVSKDGIQSTDPF